MHCRLLERRHHRPESRARLSVPVRISLVCAAFALAPLAVHAQENAATRLELPDVEVVVTTPLPEIGIPLRQVPGNIQRMTGAQVDKQRPVSISDAINANLGSVSINDTQSSPFQPDVNFRGFTASPVLGTPQGISVFVDGVRINEAFGDAVNWDLIPTIAIANVSLVPGSNPVFGLNTLGGSLSVITKSGFEYPGVTAQAYAGSFGRHALEASVGGHGETADYFIAANTFDEHGWGDHNPGRVNQLFAKTGYQDEHTDIDLSLTSADTRLEGNQPLPLSMMDNTTQSYTWPDIQKNRMNFLNLKASHFLRDDLLLAGDVYYRKVSTNIFNSNVNGNFDTALPVGPGNEPMGNAINQIEQHRPGASLQLTDSSARFGRKNSLTIGASVDQGHTDFTQYDQEAGAGRDSTSTAPLTLATQLAASAVYRGIYLTDNFALDKDTFLTVSGRYNDARVKLEDQIGTALNGDHTYRRFNPAAGLTFNPSPAWTTYANYSEGMRVPTPVELSCADPNAPCSLPNAFTADPDLKAVISKTWEFGARGQGEAGVSWSAAVFRTDLDDDILFISSGGGAVSSGYFQNVGRTLRQGVELGADWKRGPLSLSAHYSYIDATFQTPLIVNSPNNSTASAITCATCTDIQVNRGNRIPGIPRHTMRLRADIAVADGSSVGLTMMAQSNQYARGDENNRDINGPVPGFAVFNLDAHHEIAKGWELFVRIDNLLDRRYATYGILGQNVFTGPGITFDATGASWRTEQFRGMAAPRGIWVGLSYRFGGEKAARDRD